jgi:hypothetical protein
MMKRPDARIVTAMILSVISLETLESIKPVLGALEAVGITW